MFSPYLVPLVIMALAHLATAHQYNVCTLPYCECNPATHPSWISINCTVPNDKRLDILEGDLPHNTTELQVNGAEAVLFDTNSLSRLKDVRHIKIVGAKLILMRQFAAVNLNVISVYLDIQECEVLRIERKTFTNIKGPLSVLIKNCDAVSMEGEAFSWLLTMSIIDVRQLDLSSGAFMLDPTAANVGIHGPGMSIELKNLTVPEITSQTFGSSAAAITMESVTVQNIHPEAFAANTYNIVMATNCSFYHIHGEAFAQKSLIKNLKFYKCEINHFGSSSMQSAVGFFNISHSTFKNVETGAINITVATITVSDTVFKKISENSFEFSSWNKFDMQRNSFDEVPPNAIIASGANNNELIFEENEIETAHGNSLSFIGLTQSRPRSTIKYKNNYFGQTCHCSIKTWLENVLKVDSADAYETQSYCTINELLARCFNVPEQNMLADMFVQNVCNDDVSLKCDPFKSKNNGNPTEIKNPRFPHKDSEENSISDRNKKVIGIVLVTTFGCILIVLFISLMRWMRRKGYCVKVKNLLVTSNSSCATFCDKICPCGMGNGIDNAGSISQLSVHEYSERHRLNEPRLQETVQVTEVPELYTQEIVPSDDKTTQTLPEELTKELLENLKEKLDDPDSYVEAREMIEHLYELIKVEESCNNVGTPAVAEENIYELPFQNTVPRLGRNKKKMISVGTKAPSLEKLTPLSPYYRQTALAHEYFEPKDFAVHLYAEIANNERDKRNLMKGMPNIAIEQAIPRGPYLRAVHDKLSNASSSPIIKATSSPLNKKSNLNNTSTIKSNNSTNSNSSGKMINRPLPEKPVPVDPGEGTSSKHG